MATFGKTCAMALLVILAAGRAPFAMAQEPWQPTPLPLSHSPEAQPPRALLDQTVSVTLTGTVAEVVRALAEAAGRDWVVSAPSDDFGPAKEFRAENVPLWQAMDRLLETFGYDWGVHAGVLVCWPATRPVRHRDPFPRPEPEVGTEPGELLPLDIPAPTPITELLAAMSRPFDRMGHYGYVAPQLSAWRVVGHINALGCYNGQSVYRAVGAVAECAGGAMALKPGAIRRLDEALAARDEAPTEPDVLTPETWQGAREQFEAAVLGLLSGQQWELLRSGGEALLAFRELPTQAAVMFLQQAERLPRVRNGEWTIDWSRPQCLSVSVRAGQANLQQPDGTAWTWPVLTICCNVPLADGTMAGF